MSAAQNDPGRAAGLGRDSTGASSVEYVIVVLLVALMSMGAWVLLGENVSATAECVAHAIEGGGVDCSAASSPSTTVASDAIDRTAGARAASTEEGDSREARAEATDSSAATSGANVASTAGGSSSPVSSRTEASSAPEPPNAVQAAGSFDDQALAAAEILSDEETFDSIRGPDGEVDREDLELTAAHADDPDVRAAAAFLVEHPAVMNAVDVAGGGSVDGHFERGDMEGFAGAVEAHGFVDILADTSNGGDQDETISQGDLETLANDETLPRSIRDEAIARLEAGDFHHGGGGIGGFVSGAWNATGGAVVSTTADLAGEAWEHTEGVREAAVDVGEWSLRAGQRATWTFGMPVILPGQLDDYLAFQHGRLDGVVDWGTGMVTGLYGVGEIIVSRPAGVLDAVIDGDWERAGHGAFNMMTGADLVPLLGDMASGTVESVTHNVVAIGGEDPYEAGHGSSMIGLDVASVVVPGAIVTRVARTAGAATEAVAVAERGAVVSRGAAASAAERGLGATRVVDDLAAGRAVLEAAGGESAPRLVVGGGRAGDMPRLRPNDVSLNIERTTSPNVLGDINHAPFRNESFPEIVFENVEHSVFVGPGSTTVSATYDLLTPGGRLEIQFGSVNAPIDDVVTRLRAEGFRDVSVRRPTAAETREYLERLGVPEERIASVLERFEAQPSRWVIEATKPSAP